LTKFAWLNCVLGWYCCCCWGEYCWPKLKFILVQFALIKDCWILKWYNSQNIGPT
jgi:hypothetical protein